MTNPGRTLTEAASAVAVLGACPEEIDLLDDASLVAGMKLVAELEAAAQPFKLWLAAAIAKRSTREAGYQGLARRNGAATPAVFIQTLTGSSMVEATKLANLGGLMADLEPATGDGAAVPGNPVITAATSGAITLDAAEAIRRGLGRPDQAVTADQLRQVAETLIHDAVGVPVEVLVRMARQARAELDVAAVERGQKDRAARRYVRIFETDGLYGGRWLLTAEDGGAEINTALKLLLANRTDGPRFVAKEPGPSTGSGTVPGDVPASGTDGVVGPSSASGTVPASGTDGVVGPSSASGTVPATMPVLVEERSMDQILADGFTQIFVNGLHGDPTIVPGVGRAAVRVIVEAKDLDQHTGFALLEDNLSPVTLTKLQEYLCDGGTIEVTVGDSGDLINFGREQRLFTRTQRQALSVRDGGCRYPGCQKPASWCEAHHVLHWKRDHGPTNITNGILLCRYHHMLIHNNDWQITRRDGTYWLTRPKNIDPSQTPIEMPSNNPIIQRIRQQGQRERQREQQRQRDHTLSG
jgi:Domain of unknown function (DUF222)